MTAVDRELRRLPGTLTRCRSCGQGIVWAATAARDTGRGGRAMPLDPFEDPAGNVAVQPGHAGRLVARVLKKDEQVDRPVQYVAMPHFATCPAIRR